MKKVLVIGASGFVGGHVARALLAGGYAVRCLARAPSRAGDLARAGCEIVQGDISDAASVERAVEAVDAVYISIHTLSPQPGATAGAGFMDVETRGLQNIVTACRRHGVRRLIYVTSLGIAQDSPSVWLRERWKTEQFLLTSGLEVTVIRPGQIVGAGGRGFDTMAGQARRPVGVHLMGAGGQRMRHIALEDLIYYLVGVLEDPRAYGQAYDVGGDEVLTNDQRMDVVAEVLGRRHPWKIDVPPGLLRGLAPVIERMSKLPAGSIRDVVSAMKIDGVGDPMPIRMILPRTPLRYREAVERALRPRG